MTGDGHLSLPVKLAYTLFVCVLVPVYWAELGPANFLWVSDVALLATVVALWTENRLLTSAIMVGTLLPELVWNIDFFVRLLTELDIAGMNATGYMFNAATPGWLRALSLFHVFLPLLLLWMLHRLGYDRRAPIVTTVVWWILLPISWWIGGPSKNINWAFGVGSPPQSLLPGTWYLAAAMLLMPLLVYLPAHMILEKIYGQRSWGLWRH